MNWFEIGNIEEVDSPSIVLYEERLDFNLQKMLDMVDGDASKLMPHVKTNKMTTVIRRMVAKGIKRFKASTIAEAEIAAMANADSVLIAHQLVGPKIDRLLKLSSNYPSTEFSSILDNVASAKLLNERAALIKRKVPVFIDVNNGMNRSGIKIGKGLDALAKEINDLPFLEFRGLHVYDGHLRDSDFKIRKEHVEDGFKAVEVLFAELKKSTPEIQLISGGTPSFTAHLTEKNRICSPGTCVLWDWGYGLQLAEQSFKVAALLITRVISKPIEGIVTVDLGHKAVAAENPIDKRVKFLNLNDYELLSQSEEHGVIKVSNWEEIKVGDVFYGLPYHICPSINLHDEVSVIDGMGQKVDTWEILGRRRKVNY